MSGPQDSRTMCSSWVDQEEQEQEKEKQQEKQDQELTSACLRRSLPARIALVKGFP